MEKVKVETVKERIESKIQASVLSHCMGVDATD